MNARDAASGYRTGPESPCARCGSPGDRASFFHAAEGLVCESCHRAEKVAEKIRDNVREGRFMTAALGSLSAACALLSLSFVALHPAGIVTFGAFKLFAAAVAIPVVCSVRLRSYPTSTRGRGPWLAVSIASAAVAVFSVGLFALIFE